MKIAEAFVELRVDTRTARKEAVQETKKIGQDMGKALAEAFSAVAFTKAVNGAIQSASRLQQAVGATESVFKDAAAEVDRFAATSAKSFGISASAARELTAQTGALLKGFGFTTQAAAEQSVIMAKLGADLAAAFGGKPEEAVQALGSALRGEFNPAERFGVSLTAASVGARAVSMGLAESATKVDAMAKAQATLAIIMEQTTDVQGQFERELSTAAGAASVMTANLEDQRAKIGEQMLPVYARAVDMISSMVEGFASMPAPVQSAVIALAGLAAAAGPISRVVNLAGSLKGALSNLSRTQIGVAGAITAAAALYSVYSDRKREAERVTNGFVDALNAERDGQQGAINALIATELVASKSSERMKALGLSVSDVGRVIRGELVPEFEALRGAAQQGGEAIDVADRRARDMGFTLGAGQIGEFVGDIEALAGAYELAGIEVATTTQLQRGLNGVSKEWVDRAEYYASRVAATAAATGDLGEAAADATVPVDAIRESLKGTATEAERAAVTLGLWQQALDRVMGSAISTEEANRQIRDEIEALTTSVTQNGVTLDINTAAGRKNREQVQRNVDSILDLAEAMIESGASAKDAGREVDGLRGLLLAQMEQLGFTRAEAEEYIATLGLTPENVDTAIRLTKQEKTKQDIEALLKKIPGEVPTEIQTLIDEGKYAEAKRRLREIAEPVTVPVWLSIQNPTAMDEQNLIGKGNSKSQEMGRSGSGLPTNSAGVPLVGSTNWWQGFINSAPAPSSSSPSGPSAKALEFDKEFEKQKRRYSLGMIRPVEYLIILQAMRAEYKWPKLSDRGYALEREIQDIARVVKEALTPPSAADGVGAAFDQAAADQAAIRSKKARSQARREFIETAFDADASPADRKRAEEAWAQAIYDDLDAQANQQGIKDRTPQWSRFMRPRLEKVATKHPFLADEIGVLLAGIPEFPKGSGGGGSGGGGGGGGVKPTNKKVGSSGGGSGLAAAAGAPGPAVGQIVVLGTEQKFVNELIRRIDQTRRSGS